MSARWQHDSLFCELATNRGSVEDMSCIISLVNARGGGRKIISFRAPCRLLPSDSHCAEPISVKHSYVCRDSRKRTVIPEGLTADWGGASGRLSQRESVLHFVDLIGWCRLEAVLKLVRWLSKAVEFRHRRPWKAIVPVKTQS